MNPPSPRSAPFTLCPAQRRAYDRLLRALELGGGAVLAGGSGVGKTTILHHVHDRLGGTMLGARDFMEAIGERHPLALEEALYVLVGRALSMHETVIVDDVHLIANVVCCGSFYPRPNLLAAPLTALATEASVRGRRLVLASQGMGLPLPWTREQIVAIEELAPADYAAICSGWLDADDVDGLDFEKIHRFARHLSAEQLRISCLALQSAGEAIDTERFIEHLRSRHLVTNVDLGEVQAVELHDLKGLDDVLEALEANVVLPLENAELAEELSLRAKRGVLLAGPPGTGKTTVGRALAHRLRSKFFLIDGTVIAGTGAFFGRIQHIFEAAKRSAPAIVFIDDSDVLFEGEGHGGFYRYLLTLLDGIESESAGGVCLMMTAMDVGSLPPALVRSGRIELWLEMRLPDETARAAILSDRCAELPSSIGVVDVSRLAAATDGLSGADLRRVVDDGKVLFAFDKSRGRTLRPVTEYFLQAVETVRANKERYAEAEARARSRHPGGREHPAAFFEMMHAMSGGMGADAIVAVQDGSITYDAMPDSGQG